MIAMALANEPDLLDRRRADHRARRHGAGADHRAVEGHPEAARHVASVHHPRPRHRAQDRRPGLRDEGRQDRRSRARSSACLRRPSIPIPRRCSPPSQSPIRRRCNPTRRVVLDAEHLKVWFPITRGVLRKVVGHVKACDGVSIKLHQGETLGIVGKSGSGKSTLGRAILRLISSEGSIVFMGHELQSLRFKEMLPYPPRHADRVPGPLRFAVAAHVGRRDHQGRAEGPSSGDDRSRTRSSASSRRSTTSASIPNCASAFPTNFPAASASASRWRAPWCWSRTSSCSTSRPARSTC